MKEDLFNQLHEHDMPEGHELRFAHKLDNSIPLERKLWTIQAYLSAASVIIFLGISLLVLISIGEFQSSRAVFSGSSDELYETEMYLRSEIDTKLDQLASRGSMNKKLIADIKKIDSSFKQIQSDLEKNPGDDRLVSAILVSYQSKLELLDRIITQIEYYEQ